MSWFVSMPLLLFPLKSFVFPLNDMYNNNPFVGISIFFLVREVNPRNRMNKKQCKKTDVGFIVI